MRGDAINTVTEVTVMIALKVIFLVGKFFDSPVVVIFIDVLEG